MARKSVIPTKKSERSKTTDFQWITIVRDKNPTETWRAYAAREGRKYGLSTEVTNSYLSNIARGLPPREAAISALEDYQCADENREAIKIYTTRGDWIQRPRLLKIPNVLISVVEDCVNFDIYRRMGNSHTEIVIDDSEVLALLLVFATLSGKAPSKAVRDASRKGHFATKRLMRRRPT